MEELVRVADLHVGDVTGLATSVTGRAVTAQVVGRAEWARRALSDWKSLLEALAVALSRDPDQDGDGDDATNATRESGPAGDLIGGWAQLLGPAFLGIQAGTMVGHLAQRSFGQYDLPIPRPPNDELLFVPANIGAFSRDWSLPIEDVRLWVCVSEVAHHAVLGRPHVAAALDEMLLGYVAGFEPDPSAVERRMADVDLNDPTSLEQVLGDPSAMLGEMWTPAQKTLLVQATYDRGAAFARGVVERAGEEGLARLWESARTLPTPAEVDAPGLWLERIALPEDT